jgi:hypothetical protein
MNWLYLLSYFFGSVFFANAVPHFVSGTMGRPFPFAKPRGRGLSSSTVSECRGIFNALFGYFLVFRVSNFDLKSALDVAVSGLGTRVISLQAARHFGRFRGGNLPGRS